MVLPDQLQFAHDTLHASRSKGGKVYAVSRHLRSVCLKKQPGTAAVEQQSAENYPVEGSAYANTFNQPIWLQFEPFVLKPLPLQLTVMATAPMGLHGQSSNPRP